MALRSHVFDDLLQFASASRSKSAVTFAAVSFAICHLAAIGTSAVSADMDVEIPRQLIHFVAEVCRFVLPLGFMVAGLAIRAKKAPPARP